MSPKIPQVSILKTLLKGTIVLGVFSLIINLLFFFRSSLLSSTDFHGDSPANVFIFVCFFTVLYLLVEKGEYILTAIIFISIYVIIGFYSSIKWGADIPFAFLIYALAIIIAGILLNGKFAILTNIVIMTGLVAIIYLQTNNYLEFDYSWVNRQLDIIDSLIIGFILSIISLVSWLSNREIDRAFKSAKESEAALVAERNNLELKVRLRSKQLEKARLEKMIQLYTLAELGKISAGLIHELVNPLASVSANLEQLYDARLDRIDRKKIRIALNRAVAGTKEMENYVVATRKQIQRQDVNMKFSVYKSVKECVKLFSYRSKTERVEIEIVRNKDIFIHGNVVKFHQLINNLLSNALDALKSTVKPNKKITLTLESTNNFIVIKVIDNGKGISKDEINHIFDPFYTTKIESGTGIGLAITKDIVENTFGGRISVQLPSIHKTIFVVKLPYNSN